MNLVWQIDFDPAAKKELSKLDRQTAKRILVFLKTRLAVQSDPRKLGQALRGSKLVLRIGDRKEIYK